MTLFLLVASVVGVLAWRRRRRRVLVGLIVLAVLNPAWLEPVGNDCGATVLFLGDAWVVVALLISAHAWYFRPPPDPCPVAR